MGSFVSSIFFQMFKFVSVGCESYGQLLTAVNNTDSCEEDCVGELDLQLLIAVNNTNSCGEDF